MFERCMDLRVTAVEDSFGSSRAFITGHMITFNAEAAPRVRTGQVFLISEVSGYREGHIRIKGKYVNMAGVFAFEEVKGPE